MAFTYILLCADGSYYVGSTTDLDRRVAEHNSDGLGAAYTRRRRPVSLVWAAEFQSIKDAFAFEKQVQGWSRAKREASIRGDFDALSVLAERHQKADRRGTTMRVSGPQIRGVRAAAAPPEDDPWAPPTDGWFRDGR